MSKTWVLSGISVGLLFILTFFVWRPLLSPGFFTMHDDQQVARLEQLDKSLRAGQFPVRWVADLGFGYGYPLFNFYPPLSYYLGESIHLFFNQGFINSTKSVWFLALFGSGLTMYFLSREFFGRAGGLISALFYVYAPYHAVDAYVRGALAELFSFVWLPLILLFSYKAIKGNSRQWSIWTGVALAFLMITHNLVFLPFAGLLALWCVGIFLVYGDKRKWPYLIFHGLLFILVSFALTAFFWLPSLWEKQYTLVDRLLITNLASYKIHFVCPAQLWNSPWGFGGSVAGCLDGMSFKLGKLHIFLAAVSFPLAIFFWFKKKKPLALFLILGLFLFAFSVFMTTDYSRFLWDHLSLLWYLQFPWRFLEFAALFSSLLAGAGFFLYNNPLLKGGIFLALAAALLWPNAKLFTPREFLTSATDSSLTSDRQIKWYVSSTSFEYLPRGIKVVLTDKGPVLPAVTGYENLPRKKLAVISGDLSLGEQKFLPDSFSFEGTSAMGARLQINTVNFPGWQVLIDNKETNIDDNNQLRLITFFIPPGRHAINGRFLDTPVRKWGNLISVLAAFCVAGLILYGTRRSKK